MSTRRDDASDVPGFRLRHGARIMQAGGVVAYPTEGVFGLGCDPWDAGAVRRVLALKGRDAAKGLILLAASAEHLEPFLEAHGFGLLIAAYRQWEAGDERRATTWVVRAAPEVPVLLRGQHAGLAVRISKHRQAAALSRAFGGAIVSTSANRSGRPPARSALESRLRLGAAVDMVIGGATGGEQRPSRIVDLESGSVLRD
ncbi:MAG: L-threonylcarbamoyladenylate synthase [Pseudomonadota bacterium]